MLRACSLAQRGQSHVVHPSLDVLLQVQGIPPPVWGSSARGSRPQAAQTEDVAPLILARSWPAATVGAVGLRSRAGTLRAPGRSRPWR
jgi:hypothetical protein